MMVKSYIVLTLSASKSHVSSCELLFLASRTLCLQPVKMLHSAPLRTFLNETPISKIFKKEMPYYIHQMAPIEQTRHI